MQISDKKSLKMHFASTENINNFPIIIFIGWWSSQPQYACLSSDSGAEQQFPPCGTSLVWNNISGFPGGLPPMAGSRSLAGPGGEGRGGGRGWDARWRHRFASSGLRGCSCAHSPACRARFQHHLLNQGRF